MRMTTVFQPLVGLALGALVVLAVLPRAEDIALLLYPASRWLEINAVRVGSVAAGGSPRMTVERSINRPFRATWTVSVRRMTRSGHTLVCTRHGDNDYRPGSVPPADTDLNWWLAVPPNEPCPPMAPGQYFVTIVWVIMADGMPSRTVRAESNVFEVTP